MTSRKADMKKFFAAGMLSLLVVAAVLAQDASTPVQPAPTRPARRADPHIVPPRATPGLHPPDAPPLPYHFVTPPAPLPGHKFGNVSGVALTSQGHLLVYDRNPEM